MTDNPSAAAQETATASGAKKATFADLKALWHKRTTLPKIAEGHREELKSSTLGVAVLAVLIISATVTTNVHGTAIWFAMACFAFSVPLLVLSGQMFNSLVAPTTSETTTGKIITPFLLWLLAVATFLIGFIFFLWSYDPLIALVFFASLWFANKRMLRYFAKPKKNNPLSSTNAVPEVKPPELKIVVPSSDNMNSAAPIELRAEQPGVTQK